ncbi:inner membrane protein yhgN [Beauveria bassiana D1-5]|uniref:Inner membrane protein yhgN n=2 Tax=cellular organisms TaxID=131567 RepID=A0A0A2W4Q5_BEABA|nr:inner membrane protein yhgN [Beauveria bassiana D1-5]
MTEIISAAVLLILIMDPLGNLPIFMSVLKHTEPKRRRAIMIRELLIALLLMLIFLFAGEKILGFLNLRAETVSISGGIILFLIAIKMIFPGQEGSSSGLPAGEEPFIVPLAIPLVAGPSLLATLMLLSHQYPNQMGHLVAALMLAWGGTVAILLQSSLFLRLLGEKGVNALERLMGLVLIMISTQMFLDGIRTWMRGKTPGNCRVFLAGSDERLGQQAERNHPDNRPGGAEDGFHHRPGLQRLCFRRAGKLAEQPEAGVIYVTHHDRATGDTNRQGCHLNAVIIQLLDNRHHQTNRRQTGHGCGALNNTYRRRQHEAGNRDRQAHTGQRFAQCRAHAGVHQHLFEHATGTDNQQDNARRLQRLAAYRHHFFFIHALTIGQAINSHQASHQNRGERVANELQPFVQRRAWRGKASGNRFQANQHQRQQNQRQAEAKGRQLAFPQVRLGDVIRNFQLNKLADEVPEQRPGDNHARDRGAQANQDHPAKVSVHLGGQQHRRGPRQQERRSGSDAGKQRDHQFHQVCPGMTRHRKRDANQQHDSHFKEQGQRANQARQANRVVRAAVAEGLQHFDGNLIHRAGFMQNFTEHRTEGDHNRQKAQRTAHAFLHGVGDFVERHAGEKPGTNRNHHQSHEGVHTRLHY